MKVFKHEYRKTPWTRLHIFFVEAWMFAFVAIVMQSLIALGALLYEGDTGALLKATFAVVNAIFIIAILKPLKEHCYFQEIWDDCSCNNAEAYGMQSQFVHDEMATKLMKIIENPDLHPFERQEYRMELKEVIHTGLLSSKAIEEIKARHGYLL